jgi:alpha-amylase/alpha-mannosidase (GH57 family)
MHSSADLSASDALSEVSLIGDHAAYVDLTPSLSLTATGIYVTIHGHFYQPPRENPYLNAIERQPSASPFHDWNERIHHECYRPNAFARILNDRGEVVTIVNNFEYLSFNIGPTLMSWLERHDLETYQRIIDGDRKSCARLGGHGNAIAQVYNHIIMPLANKHDKYTQIRWGKADFQSRFGRDPEGMWLAETAVDYETLEALVDEGIRFIILAPSQVQRCRPLVTVGESTPNWQEVGGSQIDPTRPYRCFMPASASDPDALSPHRYIDIFFYDGPISRDMGFSDVMSHSQHLAGRLGQAVRGDHRPAQLISVATDGETFGHHKRGTEKTLAYAFVQEFPQRNWTVTNFAHYLSVNPPTWEVELKPVTAWSCAHGVDRWQADCGCGGGGTWHQQWRQPLRAALDWLRDQLIPLFETYGQQLFQDPWAARDGYIQVIRDRSAESLQRFWAKHCNDSLTADEQISALQLLELQRHTLLMYTSCGWFFEELSRPEGVQILRYAARALELAEEIAGVLLESEFIERLESAPSNVEHFKTGAEVYRQLVIPAQINLEQVAAHYAMSSLFTSYHREQRLYCYTVHQLDYQLQRLGTLTLAVGHLELTSEITQEGNSLVFAVLHLGGWDFHCCVQPFSGRKDYSRLKAALFDSLQLASAAYTIGVMNREFQSSTHSELHTYSLRNLFDEERYRIMHLLTQETLGRLNHLYTQVYRDNYSVLMAFQRDQMEVPHALQVAAEIALEHRLLQILTALEQELVDLTPSITPLAYSLLKELDAIATETKQLHCKLNHAGARQVLERLIVRSLDQILYTPGLIQNESVIQCLEQLVTCETELQLNVPLESTQELYLQYVQSQTIDQSGLTLRQLKPFLRLGRTLGIAISGAISQSA